MRFFVTIFFLLTVTPTIVYARSKKDLEMQIEKLRGELEQCRASKKIEKKVIGKQEWEQVASFGAVITVFVSPAGLKDNAFVAQVLHFIINKIGRNRPVQIMLFNDKANTPSGLPMTDRQMLHQKAQYNFNPNTKFEEFVWIKTIDAKSSPPKQDTVTANIRPGYAE